MHFYFDLPLGLNFPFQSRRPLSCFLSPPCAGMGPGLGQKHKQSRVGMTVSHVASAPGLPVAGLEPLHLCSCPPILPRELFFLPRFFSWPLSLSGPLSVSSPPTCTVPVPCTCFSERQEKLLPIPQSEHQSGSMGHSGGVELVLPVSAGSLAISSLACEWRNGDSAERGSLWGSGPQCCAICALHKCLGLRE